MDGLPEYIIKPKVSRIILPQALLTALLGIFFYGGIAINLTLLQIPFPGNIKILVIAILVLLVMIQAMLSYLQASKIQYAIYKDKIQIVSSHPQYIMFNTVQNVKQRRNFFDRIFNTGTLMLEPTMTCKAVPNFNQMFAYVAQMVQYSRTQYQ